MNVIYAREPRGDVGSFSFDGPIHKVYESARKPLEETARLWLDEIRTFAAVPGTFLDLGCGTGHFTPIAAREFGEAIGIDRSVNMLSQAVALHSAKGTRFLLGEATRLPIREKSVDAVLLAHMLHHVGDLESCGLELERVTRPGAYVFVLAGFQQTQGGALFLEFFPEAQEVIDSFATVDEVQSAFGMAGLRLDALVARDQPAAASYNDFYKRVALRSHSTLEKISGDAFDRGLEKLKRRAAVDSSQPREVMEMLVFGRRVSER